MLGTVGEPAYELAGRAPLISTILVFTDENLTYRYETSFGYSAPFAINRYCQGWCRHSTTSGLLRVTRTVPWDWTPALLRNNIRQTGDCGLVTPTAL